MVLPATDPGGRPLTSRSFADGARRIEECGFDGAWVFDAIGRGFVLPDPLTALAVAATATERIELGTCILQLGIRNPVEVAHRVMTTHLVCGERLSLGVGAGSSRPDFHAFGRSYDDRFSRLGHELDVVRRLLHGGPVDGIDLTPWEATLGGPPVLIGSWTSGTWITRAATEFDGWIASGARGGGLAEGVARYRDAGGERAVLTNVTVDLDAVGGHDVPADEPFSLRCGPAEARSRLRWAADLGFSDVVLRTDDHTPRTLDAIRRLVP